MTGGRGSIGRIAGGAVAALIAASACAGAAWAATATDTFEVTANVVASCIVSAADLAFGPYDPTSSTPLDEETTIAVTCTNGTNYTVGLDDGQGAGASIASRRMEDGADQLSYSLYKDASRSALWGDAGGQLVNGTGDGTQQNLDVYGRVPINQPAPVGSYEDTVTVTVTY